MALGHAERPLGLFRLASDAGVPWEPGDDAPFTDDAYARFLEAYEPWGRARDDALVRHVTLTPTFFRCFIPYFQRAFVMARQLVWYVDEVLVRDPVSFVIGQSQEDVERAKSDLLEVLRFLSQFREWIEDGYLLLGGRDAIKPLGVPEPSDEIRTVAADPFLTAALDEELALGIDRRLDERGEDWIIFRATLGAEMRMG
jgi:hypothetical protein